MQETLVNLYWKIRRYYWKTKPKLRKVKYFFVNHFNRIADDIAAYFEKRYWKAYSFSNRSYWKIKARLNKSYWFFFGIFEGIRVFIIRTFYSLTGLRGYLRKWAVESYWWCYRIWSKVSDAWVRGYWAVKKSALYYPFSKTYWFFHFQWNKRIKKTKN